MPRELNVYALPKLVDPDLLGDTTVVIVDVLRASTTMIYALGAGVREIIPCVEVSGARSLMREMPDHDLILGGDRHDAKVDGFDFGTSPTEYTGVRLRGKSLIFTAADGTSAVDRLQNAGDLLLGAFVNTSALVKHLHLHDRVAIICAGTSGVFSEDDVLFAGLLTERLTRGDGGPTRMNPQAATARRMWLDAFPLPQSLGGEPLLQTERLASKLRATLGGRKLIQQGMDDDIVAASKLDHFNIVPRLDAKTGRILAI